MKPQNVLATSCGHIQDSYTFHSGKLPTQRYYISIRLLAGLWGSVSGLAGGRLLAPLAAAGSGKVHNIFAAFCRGVANANSKLTVADGRDSNIIQLKRASWEEGVGPFVVVGGGGAATIASGIFNSLNLQLKIYNFPVRSVQDLSETCGTHMRAH
ncbi:hypothetical protein GWI33_003320 [Rhynchophorus ferrugineus]|uniref:Uncharacterized protein n=1 Tax=Rhynchophorus ferrugineus TaxID=354439 RepID=A0A834IJG8_RHYFE|nr:hypothetical protein GWI33_003320 [Rhynchophorus ferrugineus]